MKKVSLILTTYNCKDKLIQTFESIEEQDYPLIEVVVKDGNSQDGTVDIIRRYVDSSKFSVKWTSERDRGIYDAMNQGFLLSTGDIVVFFNDIFLGKSAVTKMVSCIETVNPDTGEEFAGAHADLVYMDGERVVRTWKMGQGTIEKGWMPGHPTLFLKREIYDKYGLYDTRFKISADYEFMIRFLKGGQNRLAYLPETIVSMFYGGTSSGGFNSYLLSLREGHRALRMNGIKRAWLVDIRRSIRVLKQFSLK